MIQKNILCVIQQPPYLGNRIFEALDAMLVAAAFEQQVSLLFRGEGVTALMTDQAPRNQRNLGKILLSLETYEIDQIYVDAAALAVRKIDSADCVIEAQAITSQEIGELMNSQDMVWHD